MFCNIEKIRVYLAPKNFLDNVKEKVKPTDDELKQAKRNKRRFEGERMRYDLMTIDFDETVGFDGKLDKARNKTINDLGEDKQPKLEDNLHKFLGLDASKKEYDILQPSSRSHFEDSESGYTNNFYTSSNINRNKMMPIEEEKVCYY